MKLPRRRFLHLAAGAAALPAITISRYLESGRAASAVAKRIAELEIEGKKLQQMQQEAFERFVRGQ